MIQKERIVYKSQEQLQITNPTQQTQVQSNCDTIATLTSKIAQQLNFVFSLSLILLAKLYFLEDDFKISLLVYQFLNFYPLFFVNIANPSKITNKKLNQLDMILMRSQLKLQLQDVRMVKQHLQVFARIRPQDNHNQLFPYLVLSDNTIELQVSRTKLSNAKDNHSFTFNHIFAPDSSQGDIFQGVARPVIDNCLDGYNGTIFAYGQTGSGKTFTMSGGDDWQLRGIIPRVVSYVFEQFERRSKRYCYELQVSFIEIYNQNAYDLLNEKHCQLSLDQWTKITFLQDQESNVQMKNLSVHQVNCEEEALDLLGRGSFIRKTNSTQSNQVSSRSHCIFTLNIKARNLSDATQIYSKIHLVDLAGSQRVSKSQAEGIVLTEAKSINLSLTYLQQVIVSLNHKAKSNMNERLRSKGKTSHVPYRNSLLTTILKDSLGGNCKTVMIATISCDRYNLDQTISTLRFAQRVKLIENETSKNQKNLYSNKIQQLERQNAILRRKISQYETDSEYNLTPEEEDAKIEKFMNNAESDISFESMAQAKRYFKKMREMYHSRLNEYVKELTFISEKLSRYDQIVQEKQKKRVL